MGINSRWLRIGVTAALAVALSSVTLRAQTLPDQLISSESIGQAEEASIQQFIGELAPKLRSDDVDTREMARDALIEPVFRTNGQPGDNAEYLASRRFRIEYGRRIRPELATCLGGAQVGPSIAALDVSAAVATDQVYELLAQALEDPSVGVRYSAARGLGDVLAAVDEQRAALTDQNINEAISLLEDHLGTESDGILVDGLSRALLAPTGAHRNHAVSAMCRGLSAQMAQRNGAAADEFMNTAFLNAMVAVRDEVRTGIGSNSLDPEFARQAGILGGSAMAFIERTLSARQGEPIEPDSSSLDELAIASEVVAALSAQALFRNVDEVPPPRLETIVRPAMQQGESSSVRTAVQAWIGRDGVFTKPPFNVPSSEFQQ